jgi:hypothetical protein
MTGRRIPKWEAELWSYVSSGDGARCPLYARCQLRKSGGWCPDDNRENINRLLDGRQFSLGSYDFIKSEGERRCRLGQLVEMMAQKYLKMGGICCPPVPTAFLALFDQREATKVRVLPLKAYHGAIWHRNDGWVIQLKNGDTSATKRFTMFHEAFHILAHCRSSPVFRKRGSIAGSFNEMLADYFAVCFLMPREWVKEKWAEIEDLDRMTEIFNVPRSAMCIRLRLLGLI